MSEETKWKVAAEAPKGRPVIAYWEGGQGDFAIAIRAEHGWHASDDDEDDYRDPDLWADIPELPA